MTKRWKMNGCCCWLVVCVCVPSQEVRKWISPPRQDRFDEKKTTEDGTSLKRPFTALECDGKRTKGEKGGGATALFACFCFFSSSSLARSVFQLLQLLQLLFGSPRLLS